MEQDLEKKIKARFAKLPEDIQKAVKSADVNKKIQEIAAKHQLHIDQTGTLGDEVLMAMMGFTDIAEFSDNISKHLSISIEKAEEVALEIGTALFIPIRESMQRFMEERSLQETIAEEKNNAPTELPKPITNTTTPISVMPKPTQPHPADLMLTQKTVSVAPATQLGASSLEGKGAVNQAAKTETPKPAALPPVTPQPYKADPYREPTN